MTKYDTTSRGFRAWMIQQINWKMAVLAVVIFFNFPNLFLTLVNFFALYFLGFLLTFWKEAQINERK